MILLNQLRRTLNDDKFDLQFESEMVQSRIISTFLDIIDQKHYTQKELESLTGLKQPFISALFNNRKKLNVEHIALFQKALNIILQPPSYLSKDEHISKFYKDEDFEYDSLISTQDKVIRLYNFDVLMKENKYKEDNSNAIELKGEIDLYQYA